jgi:two-component system sensor histidine kinase BaeS
VKIGITFKLFLAILAASAVAAAAMALATRLSFQSGFLGYLNQVDAQRLDALSGRLADEYQRRGDWDFIRNDYGRLRELAAPDQAPAQRLALLDASRRQVVGTVGEGATVRPVVVDGQTVGWVARTPFRRLTSAAELSFQREQERSAWIIVGVALTIAALIALVLARLFLVPVKRIAQASHELAAGAYDTRVPVGSGDELGGLASDFNRLAETLERNETLRRRFMADVSHELRTPLAVLSAELEALEDGVRPLSPESVTSLRSEVKSLGKLVDDLNQLALADVGALAYRKETVDVVPIVEQAVQSYRDRFSEKDLRLDANLSGEARVFGDASRLGQMFRNLLENSVRYTDRGGRLQVGVQHVNGRVELDFEDSAPSVPAESIPHIFERFYRVEGSRSRANGGTGLGLAICRSIVAAHGGEIAAEPSPLGGLRVRVSLPAT